MMEFEVIMAVLFLGAGLGLAGAKGIAVWLKSSATAKAVAEGRKELMVGEQPPELPAPGEVPKEGFRMGAIHGQPPYRHTEGEPAESEPDPYGQLDAEEKFRRFVIAVNELRDTISDDDLRSMAEKLDRDLLIEAIECDNLDSPNEKAAVLAFTLRDDMEDADAIADMITGSENPEVCISALRCLKDRPPKEDVAIAAVFTCAYEECPWGINWEGGDDEGDGDNDDDDEGECGGQGSFEQQVQFEKEAVKLAKYILDDWKKNHPDRLRDYVLNRR